MARLGLVDQTELARWADSLDAKGDLPRLIRRLILETGRGVVQLGFPGGEGIATGSWDGTVRATEATAFIPSGLSLWEVSTDKNAKEKADKDYAKRLTTPDGSPTGDCTYVAVSLRRWANRPEWERKKTSDGLWKAVRAYGVDDIEAWLESAPVTHAWLSELLGFHPHGLLTADTWWDSWSGATEPKFPADAVLAGREREIDALRAELAQPGRIITVQGASRDDVLAFVSALGARDAQTDGGVLLARTAFVDKVEAWRRLREHQAPLVLIPLEKEVLDDLGTGSAHHLIVPIVDTDRADITLPPIDSQKAQEALEAAGLPERQADETGKLARLSLIAARRRIASKPELHRPLWAMTPVSKLVRRTFLVGRWNENSAADVSIITRVLGAEYDSLREDLAALTLGNDPLLVRLDSSIGLVSPFDACLLLSGLLRKDDLEPFQAAALEVFGQVDPALELPLEQRSMASVLGKVRAHSGDLRHGLAITLALLGSHGDAIVVGSGLTGRDWAAGTVRRVLDLANKDETCNLWTSLRDVLTLLAEAAPSTFLDAVRDGLKGERPLLQRMFMDSEESSVLFSDSAHSSLLWALEICAWSPTDFGQAVDLLARLAEIDPHGQNRPIASLGSIFFPLYPQNSVSSERRLNVLDGLRERHDQIAWALMLSMLPSHHDSIVLPTSEPLFRDWKSKEIRVTRREYRNFIEEASRRLLEDVGADPERWISIITVLKSLPPQALARALGQLKELSTAERLDDNSRYRIWESLRSQVSEHREFARASWALPAAEVDQIEDIGRLFEPSMPSRRLAWLFAEDMSEIPGIHRDDNEYEAMLAELRAKAAAEIAATLKWPDLHVFALNTKMPWYFGAALAQAGITEHEGAIIGLLNSDEPADRNFATSYVAQRFRTEGWPWTERRLREGDLSPAQSGRLLLATRDFPKAWTVAEGAGESVAAVFWREFPTYGLGHDFAHVEIVAQRLLDVDRPGGALHLLALYRRKGDGAMRAELMATGLEELLRHNLADLEFRNHDLMGIFSYLEQSTLPAERIARLEWAYLPAFGYESTPPTLCRYLSQDPSFFVDLVSRRYRPRRSETLEEDAVPRRETEVELSEAEQAIARNAYRLLSSWRILPGKREDGTVDGVFLKQWVNEARRLLREVHRAEIGDNHIGMVFASSPADPDGTWPCLEVRDLLETLQSADIENGLQIRLYNDRGATTRGMLDGGDQERDLVAKYRDQAERFVDRWPRTAAVLRELADSYERAARYHDRDAERRRTGFER